MSSLRVNPYPMPDLLAALENLQKQQNTATLELGTGSRINQPSDDPAGAAQLVQIADQSSQADSFQRSISSLSGQFSTADATLASVVTALERAISLGVEGANGTLSDTDRADVATELSGIRDQLLSLANTSYQGQFIFAGTAATQPFVLDANSPSGVTYAGNAGVNHVAIGSGYQIQTNLPGSQIFSNPSADIFQSMSDLITALNANSGIQGAVNELDTAYNNVNAQRVFYDSALNQTAGQQTYLSTQSVAFAQQENAVGSANLAQVASQLENDQIASQATLEAIGKLPQTSLFDYLR